MSNVVTEKYVFDVDFVIAGRYDWDNSAKPVKLKCKVGKLWNTSSKASIDFASQLFEHFQRKSQDFVRLQTNSDSHSLPEKLKKHLVNNNKVSFENEFKHFLESVLVKRLTASQLKDGFIVAILQFKRELHRNSNPVPGTSESCFVVAMLRDTEALKLDADMRAEETLVINFKDLLQACNVDLKAFNSNYIQKHNVAKNDMAFISGTAEVRDYFHEACGVDNVVKNRDSQENLKQCLEDFMVDIKMKRHEKDALRDSIHYFIQSKSNKQISLNEFQYEVDRHIPQRLANKQGTFISFVNNSGAEVNSQLKIREALFDDLVWVKVEEGPVHMKVRRSDIGKLNSAKAVKFEKSTGKLTVEAQIKDPETIERLSKAMK